MKAPKGKGASQRLIRELQLAQTQLAKAESRRKAAKEQARLAKRRRKEAKEAARRARKQSKLAKRAVAEAKQLLARIQKKCARAGKGKAVTAQSKKAPKPAASTALQFPRPLGSLPGADAPPPEQRLTGAAEQAVKVTRDDAQPAAQNVVVPAPRKSPTQPPPPDEAVA